MTIKKSRIIINIAALIISIGFVVYYCIQRPLSDPDSYYHAAAAKSVLINGNFNPGISLPLTIYSKHPNDQHFAYHWLQSWFADNIEQLKIFQAALAALCLLVFYKFSSRLNQNYRFWALALLISSYGFMTRVSIIKSSALSITLYLIFLYSLYWPNLILATITLTAFVLAHSGFLICFFVLFAFLITNWNQAQFKRSSQKFRRIMPDSIFVLLLSIFAVVLGIALHPDRLHYLYFLKFQGLDIALYKKLALSIKIGEEWEKPAIKTLIYPNLAILIAYLPLLFYGLKNYSDLDNKKKFLLINSLIITALYFTSIRFVEYAIPSVLLYSCAVLANNMKNNKFIVLPSLIFAIVWYPLAIKNQFSQVENKIPFTLIEYVKQTVPEQSMICNLDWTDYPQLFYYLPNYKYLYGSDPRYLAFQNPEIYDAIAGFLDKPNQQDLELIKETS